MMIQIQRSARFILLAFIAVACNDTSQPAPTPPEPVPAAPPPGRLEVVLPETGELIFSGVQGKTSDAQTLTLKNVGGQPFELTGLRPAGTSATSFGLTEGPTLPLTLRPNQSFSAAVTFAPETSGAQQASLEVMSRGAAQPATPVGLYGLAQSSDADDEPSLQQVATTLGYPVDIGEDEVQLSSSSEAIGSETLVPMFEKAGDGPVTLQVVARYSREAELAYGYFTLDDSEPERREVGLVADDHAQQLLPPLAAGRSTFDPGDEAFGFFGETDGSTLYSLDPLNRGSVRHALRAYPLVDRQGKAVANSYLLGLEGVQSSDYQDAVFVVRNVKPSGAELPGEHALEGWRSLFNGRNLSGWYTYLPSKGKNDDPEEVFKVEDGMIHILDVADNGTREFGYLATKRSYRDYQLRLEYKWGSKRFEPRDRTKRDSGVIYHVGGRDEIWPTGVEYQIQKGDTGDFWMLGGTVIETTVENPGASEPQYQRGGERYTSRRGVVTRIVKDETHEQDDTWNTVDIIVRGNTAVHMINGEVNNRASDLYDPDGDALRSGRILLQAEGAEIYYRNIEIRPLGD